MPTYIFKDTNSDVSPFADGNRNMAKAASGFASIIIDPGNLGSETHGWITLANIPNSDAWENTDHSVSINFSVTNMNVDIDVRLVRLSAAGSILESGPFDGVQSAAANRVFTPSAPGGGWGTSGGALACDQRLAVELLIVSTSAHGGSNISIQVNDTGDSGDVSPITENAGTCSAPAGGEPEYGMVIS